MRGLRLDPIIQSNLESQAVREGLLTRSHYSLGQLYDIPPLYKQAPIRPLLGFISLYPNIVVTQSEFYIDQLSDKTGLSLEQKDFSELRYEYFINPNWAYRKLTDKLLPSANKETISFFLKNRNKVVKLLDLQVGKDQSTDVFYENSDDSRRAALKLFNYCFGQILMQAKQFYRTSLNGQLLSDWELLDILDIPPYADNIANSPAFERLLDKFGELYSRVLCDLFFSKFEEQSTISPLWVGAQDIQPTYSQIHQLEALVTVRIPEISILPAPRSFREAADFSHRKEIVRVRRLIAEWIESLEQGEEKAVSKIRMDLEKANKELRQLRYINEYKESPVLFGIKLVGGQIPILSNILGLVEGVAWGYERWLKDRTCWLYIDDME